MITSRLAWLSVLLLACSAAAAHPSVGAAKRAAAGFDPKQMEPADRLIDAAVERGDVPGAVLLVGNRDRTLYRKAYGSRVLEPEREPMTPDVIFDLASL